VPRVVARLYDPVREDTYHALGLMETVCTTVMASEKIHEIVLGQAQER
jgi:trk system potassium uptake protein TrkA